VNKVLIGGEGFEVGRLMGDIYKESERDYDDEEEEDAGVYVWQCRRLRRP
jgi:hypothetical protein